MKPQTQKDISLGSSTPCRNFIFTFSSILKPSYGLAVDQTGKRAQDNFNNHIEVEKNVKYN
jgi:hypothetical protein